MKINIIKKIKGENDYFKIKRKFSFKTLSLKSVKNRINTLIHSLLFKIIIVMIIILIIFIKEIYILYFRDYKVCLCVVGKLENNYAVEFVEHYKKYGIDKIIIYDNNDIEGETIDNILKYYINNHFIEIIDVRGISSIQIPIYNYCYKKNKGIYDWIGFIDIDEYLYIKNEKNIKNYFFSNRFKKCQTIYFNWIIYSDNDKIKYENKPLNKRFTIQKSTSIQGKSFVRGGFNNLIMPTTMIPGVNIYYFCNSNGGNIYPRNFYNNKFEKNPKAYIKHYYTKTVEEFCYKLCKGNAHFNKYHHNYNNTIKGRINLFFLLNKITKEKIKILENCTGINLQKYLKKENNL